MPKTNHAKNRQNGKSPATTQGQKPTEVEFVLDWCDAEHVYICGDFNDWHPACLRMIGNPDAGLWEKRLALTPGRYEYKFIVDGNWVHDPGSPENVPNIFGTLNSVVEVRS